MLRAFVVLACAGCLSALAGCSEGVTHVELPPADLSRLSPEEAVLELARTGDVEQLKQLVEANPQLVYAHSVNDETPLHIAAENGHDEVAAYLLQKGADPAALNATGDTPAGAAKRKGHDRTAEVLAQAGSTGGR